MSLPENITINVILTGIIVLVKPTPYLYLVCSILILGPFLFALFFFNLYHQCYETYYKSKLLNQPINKWYIFYDIKLAINNEWIFKWSKMKVFMGKLNPINLQHLDKDVKRETFFYFYFFQKSWRNLFMMNIVLFYSIFDGSFPSKSIHVDNGMSFFCFLNHSLTTLQDQLIYNG
jgi:hypothetical protein